MIIAIFDVSILLIFFGFLHFLRQKKYSLSVRIVMSLILGILCGLLLRLTPHDFLFTSIKRFLELVGFGYLALLKMLVVPLILTSIIHAIVNLNSDQASLKKISFTTVGMLLGMTAISSLIGLLIGKLFNVGVGLSLPTYTVTPKHPYSSFIDTLLAMIPSNPFFVMSSENTVGVVIFAILLGVSARLLDKSDNDKMQTFHHLTATFFAIVKKLAVLILGLTPYGILALMSLMLADQGLLLLSGMLNFIAAMYVAMFLVMVMHTLILFWVGYSPIQYFKNAIAPLFVAFTTRSSFGSLPVIEETLRNNFKTNQTVATFVPSLGATIGMNACAGVFPAMLVVMALSILHQPMTLNLILMVMFINSIASLGISGIPGTAYIAATITLTSLNLPYAVVALVQGIDPIIDMGRTSTNVNGTMTTALTVNRFVFGEKKRG